MRIFRCNCPYCKIKEMNFTVLHESFHDNSAGGGGDVLPVVPGELLQVHEGAVQS